MKLNINENFQVFSIYSNNTTIRSLQTVVPVLVVIFLQYLTSTPLSHRSMKPAVTITLLQYSNSALGNADEIMGVEVILYHGNEPTLFCGKVLIFLLLAIPNIYLHRLF